MSRKERVIGNPRSRSPTPTGRCAKFKAVTVPAEAFYRGCCKSGNTGRRNRRATARRGPAGQRRRRCRSDPAPARRVLADAPARRRRAEHDRATRRGGPRAARAEGAEARRPGIDWTDHPRRHRPVSEHVPADGPGTSHDELPRPTIRLTYVIRISRSRSRTSRGSPLLRSLTEEPRVTGPSAAPGPT
jgi:hypothetical protein